MTLGSCRLCQRRLCSMCTSRNRHTCTFPRLSSLTHTVYVRWQVECNDEEAAHPHHMLPPFDLLISTKELNTRTPC